MDFIGIIMGLFSWGKWWFSSENDGFTGENDDFIAVLDQLTSLKHRSNRFITGFFNECAP